MGISQENENCQRQKNCQSPPPRRTQQTERLTFPKSARILSRRHYQSLFKARSRFTGIFLTIDYRIGRSLCPRLGITVSKKYGKAHHRNRFKRLVREAFRIKSSDFPQDLEINVMPRPMQIPSREIAYSSIAQDFAQLIEHLRESHGS